MNAEQSAVVLEIFERYAKGESAKAIVRDLRPYWFLCRGLHLPVGAEQRGMDPADRAALESLPCRRRYAALIADCKAELAALDRQIAALADTIVAVGKSDGLTTKLRELEKQKRALSQQARPVSVLMTGAADQWREVVTNLAGLGKYAKPDELETARMILHDYIGEVSVVEDAGRLWPRESEQRREV